MTPPRLPPTRLSPRLAAVADLVPHGARLGDIGCDHGLLPIWLLEQRRIESAVGIDIHPGPLARAARYAGRADYRIDLRLGDGLSPLRPGEVSAVSIAGMGGARTCSILAESPVVAAALDRIILQPNTDWATVRAFLLEQGMRLVGERMVEDRGKFYVVLEVDPKAPPKTEIVATWNRLDLRFGPHLRRDKPAPFLRWIEHRRDALMKVLERIRASGSPQPHRTAEVHRDLDDLRRALQP